MSRMSVSVTGPPVLSRRCGTMNVVEQLGQAVLDVAPAAGQLAGQLDGRAGDLGAAAAVAEERLLGEGSLRAGTLHVRGGPVDVAGALLGDDDGGLYFGDGAGLLDGGALAEARGYRQRRLA